MNLPEIKVTKVDKTHGPNVYLITCEIIKGTVEINDIITAEIMGKTVNFIVKNIYINSQQTPMGIKDEIVTLVVQFINKTQLKNIGFIENKNFTVVSHTLLKSSTKTLQESISIIEELDVTKGLSSVINAGNIAKGVSIAAVISVFAYKIYDKFSASCINKIGRSKLQCKADAYNKVINSLSQQQSQCNTLMDQLQRKKCLSKVEKVKKNYILKLKDIQLQLSKYK